jgi:ferric iron reductase protein FhuF
MKPFLADRLPEPLAWYADRLVLANRQGSLISGRDLLDGDTVERLMARFAASHRGGDRRALVSMWTQWHFGLLIVPATAAILMLDRDLPLALDEIGIVPHETGRPDAFVLAELGTPHRTGEQRFARLFDGHVALLVAGLAARFRVSPRLLWSNAAAIFEWALQQVPDGAGQAEARTEARDLLERRLDSAGQRNPMFDQVRYPLEAGEPVRRRKLCCLRYLLPGVADCGSLCPVHTGDCPASDAA